MNTSLSTARIRVSSARDTPMPLPISELFHGTMTSDFGASWLPRIEIPARALGSPAAACAFGAGAASCAVAPAAPASNHAASASLVLMASSLSGRRAPLHVGDPNRGLRVIGDDSVIRLVVAQCTAVVALIQVAENREILVRHVKARVQRERSLVARARIGESTLLAIDQRELVESDRVIGADLD